MSGDAPEPFRPEPIGGPTGSRPLRARALVAGVAVDWFGTFAASLFVLMAAGMVAASRYETESEIEGYLERLVQAPDFVILMSVVGIACVALGGFVAGRLAARDEVRHALLVGAASLVIGLAMELSSTEEPVGWNPTWLRVLGHALVIPAALFGGFAARAWTDGDASPGVPS